MTARATDLAPEVRVVLERSAWDAGVLKLPGDQLERKLYVAVNNALESLGGKWNRFKKGHVFASDAEAKLREMLSSGVVPPKNPNAFFPTPPAVVERMLDLAEIPDAPLFMLEPSAGTGVITRELVQRYPLATVHAVEIHADRARELALGDRSPAFVWNVDFLTWSNRHTAYDRILMNPPFALDGDATAWMTHLRHALSMLSPDGVLVSVVPVSFAFREDRKHLGFRREIFGRSTYHDLDQKSFAESGTGVNTGLLVVQGAA